MNAFLLMHYKMDLPKYNYGNIAVGLKKIVANLFIDGINIFTDLLYIYIYIFISILQWHLKPFQDLDVHKVMKTLDVNGDGFVELDEVAHVTGLKVGNPILVRTFHKADVNGE